MPGPHNHYHAILGEISDLDGFLDALEGEEASNELYPDYCHFFHVGPHDMILGGFNQDGETLAATEPLLHEGLGITQSGLALSLEALAPNEDSIACCLTSCDINPGPPTDAAIEIDGSGDDKCPYCACFGLSQGCGQCGRGWDSDDDRPPLVWEDPEDEVPPPVIPEDTDVEIDATTCQKTEEFFQGRLNEQPPKRRRVRKKTHISRAPEETLGAAAQKRGLSAKAMKVLVQLGLPLVVLNKKRKKKKEKK